MRKLIPVVVACLFFPTLSCKQKEKPKPTIEVATSTVGTIIEPSKEGVIDTVKKSIKAYVTNKIGPAQFTISYYSPAVRDRIIWGGLVPYDHVWVTGAHSATNIQSDHDFVMGDKTIPAGKYALFTIPGKNEWIFIINKNWGQHLADNYSEAEDVLRLKVKPDTVVRTQERLRYAIDPLAKQNGQIEMSWEKLRIVVPLRVP
jgi:Protein of unknown function (DUF2911)